MSTPSKSYLPFPRPSECPVDLSRHIDHIGAPMEWVEKFGQGYVHGFPMLCPVCRTDQVFIRRSGSKQDAYLLSFPKRDNAGIITETGRYFEDGVGDRGVGLGIPMCCASGHRFLLNIDHDATDPEGERPCKLSVVLDSDAYAPDLHIEELSDYDDPSDANGGAA